MEKVIGFLSFVMMSNESPWWNELNIKETNRLRAGNAQVCYNVSDEIWNALV